ncbi:TetR/AcrR family transcriptional regulator [Prevotella falsenii]|uniref:TetR/AcrR family transcriptional regulator n=1 Tax=Prevotella falsenii TaxID=515414 RepID=UPI000A4FCFFA|nr:TetR/AcrR family transcriptional regulator [Prevotella falsenii]
MVIENDYKKEVKAKILQSATTMFFQNGIRKVKMDDIAAHLKISKRTLYEIYQNKEDLLYEVVVLNDKRGLEKLEEFDKPGVNVINITMHFF